MSRFKTKSTENYSKATHVNNVYGGQKKPRKKQPEEKKLEQLRTE